MAAAALRDKCGQRQPSIRILELATPKEDKGLWLTKYRKVIWGNQETIWPLSLCALSAEGSKRIFSLARPKKNFQPDSQRCRPLFQYGWDQSSSASGRVPVVDLPSERIIKLAEPRKRTESVLEQRPHIAALTYEASNRILQLAVPKPVHADHLIGREVETHSKAASAVAAIAPRGAHRLSNPKLRRASPCIPVERPEVPIRPVSKMATCAVASPRMLVLAKPKDFSSRHQLDRSQIWQVSRGAVRAIATPRTVQLSQPVKRAAMNVLQYTPDAFVVKEAAKKSACSSRIEALAQPIIR